MLISLGKAQAAKAGRGEVIYSHPGRRSTNQSSRPAWPAPPASAPFSSLPMSVRSAILAVPFEIQGWFYWGKVFNIRNEKNKREF